MNNRQALVSGNISFATLLQITFIVLKLCNIITWKWVFVLMPLLVEAGIAFILLIILLISLIGVKYE